MQINLTAQKAKVQARALARYMGSIRHRISLGHALEGVAAMYGCRDWNTLHAQLRAQEQSEESRAISPSTFVGMSRSSGRDQPLPVVARVWSDDGCSEAEVDVGQWLLSADLTLLSSLLRQSWSTEWLPSELGQFDDVRRVLRHVEQANRAAPGAPDRLLVQCAGCLREPQVLRFCRAFRPEVFTQLMLVREFGGLAAAEMAGGIAVRLDPDQPGKWLWRVGNEGPDVSYSSSRQAWRALGDALETRWQGILAADVLDIVPGSGKQVNAPAAPAFVTGRVAEGCEVLVLAPGQPHLSKQQLREITNYGEFALQVAVCVSLDDIWNEDLEWLNDRVSELITGSIVDLESIEYETFPAPKGVTLGKLELYLKVTANWAPMDGMDDDPEER